MRIVPAATPVCSARSLIASFFTRFARDNVRRRARSGFPEPSWVAVTDYMRQPDPILVTGATGYVGSKLVDELLARGHDVRTLSRRGAGGATRARATCCPARACPRRSRASRPPTTSSTRWAAAATSRPRTARPRSTSPRPRRGAGVERVIYLGGLGSEDSEHLRSRHEVAQLLRARLGERLVYVRAAMIIGPGSASYDILEHLVKRLPVMIVPRWLDTKTQPVALAGRRARAGRRGRARGRAGRAPARRLRGPHLS